MKDTPHEPNPSCSCTSCTSAPAPLKRSDGEGVDKLNLGKNIPSKERILLTKLTRARADYDALRKELLSSSSGTKKADLRPRKHAKHHDGSVLLDIVDLVDRGGTLESLSECCNCCVCSSTEMRPKKHRHQPKHGYHRREETVSEGGDETKGKRKKKGKYDMESKAESEPSTIRAAKLKTKKAVKHKAEESKPVIKEKSGLKRALRSTASKLKSVSCTCTLKISGFIKDSKAAVKKLRKEKKPVEESYDWIEEYKTDRTIRRPKELSWESYEKIEDTKRKFKKKIKDGTEKSLKRMKDSNAKIKAHTYKSLEKVSRESYEKIEETKRKVKKRIKGAADKSLEKIKESKTKIKAKANRSLEKIKTLDPKEKIKEKAKKSLEKLKDSKTKLEGKINKSLERIKEKVNTAPKHYNLKHAKKDTLITESKIEFPIDNKTLNEFRKHHKDIKDWACEPECIPGKCKPKKCLEILIHKKDSNKQTRTHKMKFTNSSASTQAGEMSTMKEGPKRNLKPQKYKKQIHKKPPINISMKGKTKTKPESKRSVMAKSVTTSLSLKSVKKGTTPYKEKKKKRTSPERKRSAESITNMSQPTAATSRFVKKKSKPPVTKVKSDVSCSCPSAVSSLSKYVTAVSQHRMNKSVGSLVTKRSTKSVTETSRPSAKVSHSISFTQKPKMPHKTKKIKAVHKKRPVSRSTISTSRTDSFTQKRKSPKHRIKKVKATHVARSTTSQSTIMVPVKLHKKPGPHRPKKLKQRKSQGRTATSRHEPKAVAARDPPMRPEPHQPKTAVSQGTTAISQLPKPKRPRETRREPIISATSTERQAVKIGSTHSFEKEFYKNKPEVQQERRDRSVRPSSQSSSIIRAVQRDPEQKIRGTGAGRREAYIKHRHSQQSVSMSRQSTKINSLRKCFCTLKLGKPNKIKRKPKPMTVARGSEISSRQSIRTIPSQQKKYVSRTVATEKRGQELNQGRKLLPYECEPGICVPDNCDPYQCIKLINKRCNSRECLKLVNKGDGPHFRRHARHSGTRHKTRSTSNITSRNVPYKTQRVQSTVFTYKTEVPAQRHHNETVASITEAPRVAKISPSSPGRQAVRIGSSFSFSIEFYKNKPSDASGVPVRHIHRQEIPRKEVTERRPKSPERPKPPKPLKVKQPRKKLKAGSRSNLNVKRQKKSTSTHSERTQRTNIGSTLVKCLCNLKLKKTKPKKKTSTPSVQKTKVATIGTKTKKKKYKLKPYVCEPHVCIPGECNPYECLERMKRKRNFGTSADIVKRRRNSGTSAERLKRRRNSGSSAERMKTMSASSGTCNCATGAGIGTDKFKVKGQDTSTKRRKIRNVAESVSPTQMSRPTSTAPYQIHLVKRPAASSDKQAVKIGSSFSFNIEFYKNRPSVQENVLVYPRSERLIHESLRQIKKKKQDNKSKQTDSHRKNVETPASKVVSQSNQESQATNINKHDRKLSVNPLLKRCFCTLQLQKELKKKQKPTAKIYTVSRVTFDETRMRAHRRLLSYQYELNTLAQEYELRRENMGNKRYLHPDASGCTIPLSYSESYLGLKHKSLSQDRRRRNKLSNDSLLQLKQWDAFSVSGTETELNSFTSFVTFSTENNKESRSVKMNQTNKLMESSEQKTSFSLSHSLFSGINPFLRRWFYSMNIQTINKNELKTRQWKSYDCESSTCVSYQCDSKQSMKRYSRLSTTSISTRSLVKAQYLQSTPKRDLDRRMERLSPPSYAIESIPISLEKHAEYVGSSFSLNTELSQAFSQDHIQTIKHHLPQKSSLPHSTEPPHVTKLHRKISQSTTTVATKTSDITSKLKRCLCNIKLLKEDSREKRKRDDIAQSKVSCLSRNYITEIIRPLTVDQNTKQIRSIQVYRLDPNECEPGICKPGECDPLKCLELIKQRNKTYQNRGLGTGSHSTKKSIQSHTDKKHEKRKHIQSDTKERKHRANVAKEKHSSVSARSESPSTIVSPLMEDLGSGSRQAVKIGSKFSFDLEFYKDSSQKLAPSIIKEVKPPQRESRVSKDRATGRIHSTNSRTRSTKSHEAKSTKGTGGRRAPCIRQSQISTLKRDQGTGSSKLKRCFCTLQFQKEGKYPVQAAPNKKIEKPAKSQSTKTRPYKPIPTAYSRSVMAKEKTLTMPKLQPNECEPGVCVPGSCNPMKCLERIKRRHSKEIGTDAKRSRTASTKSAGITRNKAKKVQRQYIRPRATQSTVTTTTRARKVKEVHNKDMNMPKQQIIRNSDSTSNRQVVRIGSNFSFNVEFLKERGFSQETINKVKQVSHSHSPSIKKIKREVQSRPSRVEPPKTKYHRRKNIRDMKSQVVAKKVRKTMTTVKPFLKRCFCTLKLQNREKPKENKNVVEKPVKKAVKNVSSALNKKPHKTNKLPETKKSQKTKKQNPKPKPLSNAASTTTTNLKVIMPPKANVNTKTNTNKQKHGVLKLEPNECEPGVCIPGQCDPYECLKRIKGREMKTTKSGNSHRRGRSASSYTTRTSKVRGGQTKEWNHKRQDRQSQVINEPSCTKEKYLVETPRFQSNNSSLRQAVRISSSFTFNMEFYKERIPFSSYETVPAEPKPGKIEPDPNQTKPKRTSSHAAKKLIRSQGVYAQEKKTKHLASQHKEKTDNKGAGVPPLLKRCFCTLALIKRGSKPKSSLSTSKTQFESKNVATKTRKERKPNIKQRENQKETATVGVATKKNLYVLKPSENECEPFVCVPGECDAYECDKRIRRRLMKDCGTGHTTCKNKCAVTYTPQDGTFRCIDTQCKLYKKKHRTTFATTDTIIPSKPCPNPRLKTQQQVIRAPKQARGATNLNRQSIKIGSNFGFNMEFFKDTMPGSGTQQKIYVSKDKQLPNPKPIKGKKVKPRKILTNTTGTGKTCVYRDQKLSTGVGTDHKSTGMGALKRCFCTLKLQKAPVNVMRVEVQHKVASQTKAMHYKAPKKEKPRKRNAYECDPGYSIPGECDPYKCIERINRRFSKDQGTGDSVCDQGTKCITAKCIPTCKHQKIQCKLKHGKKYPQQTEFVPKLKTKQMLRQGIVEVPRFPKFRQGVRIGSNICCSIEFYKETLPPSFKPRYEPEKIHKIKEPNLRKLSKDLKTIQECPRMKHAHTDNSSKQYNEDCDVQTDCVRKANKGIDAGKMLKRCFCTLKLQQATTKKMYTVGRVALLEDRRIPHLDKIERHSKASNRHENYILPTKVNNYSYDCIVCKEKYQRGREHIANKTDSMKTIYPYLPHKFNNNISKTLINNKNMQVPFPGGFYCSNRNYVKKGNLEALVTLKNPKKKQNKIKKFKKNKQIVKEESDKTIFSKFKRFTHRCMQLFTKSTTDKTVSNIVPKQPVPIRTELKKRNKRGKQERVSNSNMLKMSKSYRHHRNAKTVSIPKTSKSAKVTKVSERDKYYKTSRYLEQEKNIYSRFQSGDTALIRLNHIQNCPEKIKHSQNKLDSNIQKLIMPPPAPLKNNHDVICYYNQVHYNDEIMDLMERRPPFIDQKMVQMATMQRCIDINCDADVREKQLGLNCPCTKTPQIRAPVGTDRVQVKVKLPKYKTKDMAPRIQKQKGIIKNPNMPEKGCPQTGLVPQKPPAMPPTKPKPGKSLPLKTESKKEGETCRSLSPCVCCKGKRRQLLPCSKESIKTELKKLKNLTLKLSGKKVDEDKIGDDKKHVEFTISKHTDGKCVVECKTGDTNDICNIKKALSIIFKTKEKEKMNNLSDPKPLLEMRLGSEDLKILNRDDIYNNIKKMETKKYGTSAHYRNIETYGDLTTKELIQIHGKSCGCCICKLRRRQDNSIAPKLLSGQKPCICGSKPCAKQSMRVATEIMMRKKAEREKKVCPCGMEICKQESLKRDVKNKFVSKNMLSMAMTTKKLEEVEKKKQTKHQVYLKRQQKYKMEDAARRKRQKNEDKYLEKQTQIYENTSDVLLVAESALDFTKLVLSTAARTMRCLFRSVFDIKHTMRSLKNAKDDPSRIMTNVKGAITDSGIKSALKRIRMRLEYTRIVQMFKTKVKNVTALNFIVHAFDRDAKNRLSPKKRKRRRREPIEFECSLFMASLRKRPFLAVYYTCPWFYPHCMSMMNIIRNTTDALLFLLAVVFWSPCILAMEICRVCMCCTLCTG